MLLIHCFAEIDPSSWCAVDYGVHGPPCPSSPQPDSPVFHLPLCPEAGFAATSCLIWTRDGGEWISIQRFNKLVTKGRAAVLDFGFMLSPDDMACLRNLHKAVGTFSYLSCGILVHSCAVEAR